MSATAPGGYNGPVFSRFLLLGAVFSALLSGCAAGQTVDAGPADAGGFTVSDGGAPYNLCVPGLQPTLNDIVTRVFVPGCGASLGSEVNFCHSDDGAQVAGGLSLQTDPYHALLGDGGGALASNIHGSATGLRRVVPGDPSHSFLVVKLQTHATSDPLYGRGMPYPFPGSMCAATLAAIETWIADGGPND